MARRLVECVPNFSEGRDKDKVAALAAAVTSVPGAILLDQEMDGDHNRSVLTFVAPPEVVVDAALAAAGRAVELIDLTQHRGVHPRIGATDVIPFVPLEGVTLEECVKLAEQLGAEMWKRFKVPVYLYEAAARRPDRVNLENLRRGQFEGLLEEVRVNPERLPDFGEPALHPTAGATVVGARKFLIAYNIHLGTADVEIARKIAKGIRFSSGGYRYVKAMGVELSSRKVAQVSMNLTDFEQTPVHRVFETVRSEAARYGVSVTGSEIVGLIPKKALEITADFYLRFENFQPSLVLENRVADALAGKSGLAEFLDALAAPTPAPGGGSAAAAAGGMAAALGAMASRLAKFDATPFEEARAFFTAAVDGDAAAFNLVMAAYRMPKAERGPHVEAALREAAEVPMQVAEQAHRLSVSLADLAARIPARFASDVTVAQSLASAAQSGAVANVRINLESMKDEAARGEFERRLGALAS